MRYQKGQFAKPTRSKSVKNPYAVHFKFTLHSETNMWNICSVSKIYFTIYVAYGFLYLKFALLHFAHGLIC